MSRGITPRFHQTAIRLIKHGMLDDQTIYLQLRLRTFFYRHCGVFHEQVHGIDRRQTSAHFREHMIPKLRDRSFTAVGRYQSILDGLQGDIRPRFVSLYDTFKRWQVYILNYFTHRITNAFTEGVHTRIKLLTAQMITLFDKEPETSKIGQRLINQLTVQTPIRYAPPAEGSPFRIPQR